MIFAVRPIRVTNLIIRIFMRFCGIIDPDSVKVDIIILIIVHVIRIGIHGDNFYIVLPVFLHLFLQDRDLV